MLKVLSVGSVNPPQITYEYTVPRQLLHRYSWVVKDWTFCDRMCQGTMHKRVVCQGVDSQEIVSDSYCPAEKKPREESQSCNMDCEIRWHEVSHSECSNHCGHGSQSVKYRCVQVSVKRERNTDGPLRFVPPYVCYHLEHPPERRTCLGPCESAHWRYGPWSPCSVTCGDSGVQLRHAQCVDADNRTLSDDRCSKEARIDRQGCGGKTCPKWAYGDWNPVSYAVYFIERKHWA